MFVTLTDVSCWWFIYFNAKCDYGMENFLMEKYSPEVFFDALKNKRITIASIVTVMLKDLLDLLTSRSEERRVGKGCREMTEIFWEDNEEITKGNQIHRSRILL